VVIITLEVSVVLFVFIAAGEAVAVSGIKKQNRDRLTTEVRLANMEHLVCMRIRIIEFDGS